MSKKNINFKIMLGLIAGESTPEDLKESMSSYLRDKASPEISKELDNIIEKYCLENDISAKIVKDIDVSDQGIEIDEEELEDIGENIENFFKKLGAKRGIEVEIRKNELSEELGDDLTQDLQEISKAIKPDSTAEEKSILAFNLLNTKIKIENRKLKLGLDNLHKGSVNNMERLRKKVERNKLDEFQRNIFESLDSDFKRLEVLLEKTDSDLSKLFYLDEEEYRKFNLDEQLKYLENVKSQFVKNVDFLKEEFEAIKNKLLKSLSKGINLGEHLEAVIFEN